MDLEHNQQTLKFTDEKVEGIEIEENNLEVSLRMIVRMT